MEQDNQQIDQEINIKSIFPFKTRIAAWWMLIIGFSALMIAVILYNQMQNASGCLLGYIIIFPITIFGLLFFIPGLLILFKKRYGWWLTIIILSIETIIIFKYLISSYINGMRVGYVIQISDFTYLLVSLITIIPLIFLLLDRKNFWKITK